MKLVVDASVVAKWIFIEPDTDRARRLFARFEKGEFELLAPEILAAEIGSVLATRVLRRLLEGQEAAHLYSTFARACPELRGIAELTPVALELAIERRHSIYDALYVALAVQEDCDFVTADQRLQKAFVPAFSRVRLLRDWKG